MNLHANAALSWAGRRRLCELVEQEGWTVVAAARSAGVSVRCARKWIARYRLEGAAGLRDRSSAPRQVGLASSCTSMSRSSAGSLAARVGASVVALSTTTAAGEG